MTTDLSPVQVKSVARELTAKAIENDYLPHGRTGKEAAEIVLDFYHELSENINDADNTD